MLDIRKLAATVLKVSREMGGDRIETKNQLELAAGLLLELAGDPKPAERLPVSASPTKATTEAVNSAGAGPRLILSLDETPLALREGARYVIREEAIDDTDYTRPDLE